MGMMKELEQMSPEERIRVISNGDEELEAELKAELEEFGTIIGFEREE